MPCPLDSDHTNLHGFRPGDFSQLKSPNNSYVYLQSRWYSKRAWKSSLPFFQGKAEQTDPNKKWGCEWNSKSNHYPEIRRGRHIQSQLTFAPLEQNPLGPSTGNAPDSHKDPRMIQKGTRQITVKYTQRVLHEKAYPPGKKLVLRVVIPGGRRDFFLFQWPLDFFSHLSLV